MAEVLVREFLGLPEVQTRQLHPGIGTPVDVPQPRIFKIIFVLTKSYENQ